VHPRLHVGQLLLPHTHHVRVCGRCVCARGCRVLLGWCVSVCLCVCLHTDVRVVAVGVGVCVCVCVCVQTSELCGHILVQCREARLQLAVCVRHLREAAAECVQTHIKQVLELRVGAVGVGVCVCVCVCVCLRTAKCLQCIHKLVHTLHTLITSIIITVTIITTGS
jgi:hypothetical protein